MRINAPEQRHEFTWDAAGRMVKHQRGNGLVSEFGWNSSRKMISQTVTRPDGRVLLCQEYSYNRDGDLVEMKDSRAGSFSYSHDRNGRVVKAVYPDSAEEFAYDGADNVIFQTHTGRATIEKGNRIAGIGEARFSYDPLGNTICIEKGLSRLDLEYNDFCRLSRTIDEKGRNVKYSYDPIGRRVIKESEKITHYTWDNDRLVKVVEKDGENGQRDVHFLYLPDSGEPISVDVSGEIIDLHCDPVGFPMHTTNSKGELTWSGWRRLWGDNRPGEVSPPHPFGFLGQTRDHETGLYYNYARYYHSESGRYLTHDPIGFAGGLNPYAYVPNPMRYVDPLGLGCRSVYEDETTSRMRIRMPKGEDTVHGARRDRKFFWDRYMERDAKNNPRHLSPKNQRRIERGRSPRVDKQWIAAHPMDAAYRRQTLIHHHEHQRRSTVAIPDGVHRSNHGALHPDHRT